MTLLIYNIRLVSGGLHRDGSPTVQFRVRHTRSIKLRPLRDRAALKGTIRLQTVNRHIGVRLRRCRRVPRRIQP